MVYQPVVEKTAIVSRKKVQPECDDIFQKCPEIRNVQRTISFFLSIELVIVTIYLILQIVDLIFNDTMLSKTIPGVLIELSMTVILITYIIVFIIVVTVFLPVVILIFGFLSSIQLMGGFLLLVVALMVMIENLSSPNLGIDIILDVIHVIVAISVIILSTLILLSSWNLRTLMKK